jgi:hypothetical protein
MSNPKSIEIRVRRKAQRRGYTVHKSRTRDPLALDFDKWTVKGPGAPRGPRTLDEVEAFLDTPRDQRGQR